MSLSAEQSNQKQRINMTHGFMKSVIRNQIDRDKYDKEVKAKRQGKSYHSHRPTSKRPKKPELQTYVPPRRLRKDDQDYVFTLEYEHKDGEILKIEVHKNECPDHIATNIGEKFNLSEEFIEALSHLLKSEMNARVS